MTSEDSTRGLLSEILSMDKSDKGVGIPGLTGATSTKTSGVKTDENVGATIRLDHLSQNEIQNIMSILKPYDKNLTVEIKDPDATADLGNLGLDLKDRSEMLPNSYNLKKNLSLDASAVAPDISLDSPSGTINTPERFGSGISGPSLNGDLPSLTLNKPSVDGGGTFSTPTIGLNGTNVKGGDLGGTFKAPSSNLKQDLSLDASAKAPGISLDGPSGKLNASQGFGGNISVPTVNGDFPSLSVNKPSVDSGAKVSMPNEGLTQLSTPSASVGIKKPELKKGGKKYMPPKFTMPNFNLPQTQVPTGNLDDVDTPNLKLKALELHTKNPDVALNGPKLDFSDPNVQPPNLDIESPSKINWPHSKLKKPKLHSPKTDAALHTPNLNVNLPKADIESPNFDVETSAGKPNWPHLKWKKVKAPKADINTDIKPIDTNLSAPTFEGKLNAPKAEVDLPKADLKCPDFSPDLDTGASFSWPNLKAKTPNIEGLNADIDADLKSPDLSVSPSLDGHGAGLALPSAHVDKPSLDYSAPNLDVDTPSGSIKLPSLKKPKFSGFKLKSPDLDADVSTPDLSLSGAKIDGDLNTPDISLPNADLEAPKLDIDTPDLETSNGKFKWLHLKKPKASGLKVKSPDFDTDLSAPDLSLKASNIDGNLNAPDLNLPKADLEAPKLDIDTPDLETSNGKFKWLHLKKPKASGLKVKSPDFDTDLSAPDLSLKASNIDGNLNAPDLNLPKADLEAPKLDIDTPDLETSTGKWKWPTFKKPKGSGLKLKTPDLDTDLSAPDLSLKAPNIDGDLNAPDLNLPKADLEAPKLDIDTPDLETSTGKWKWPTFKKPKGSGLKLKTPDFDTDLSAPDLSLSTPQIGEITGPDLPNIDAPDIEAPSGKIKFPTLKKPKFGTFKGLKHDINADAKIPDVNLKGPNINLDTPDTSLTAPKIDTPDFKLTTPKADIGPDIGLNSGDLKLDPKLKLPSAETTAPDLDLKASGLSLKAPKTEGNLPKADLKGPKWPKFGFSTPTVKGPSLDVDGDLKAPNLSFPDGNVDLSGVGCNTKDLGVNLSSPKLNGNLLTPTAGVGASSLEGPEVHVKPPAVDTAVEKHKFPHFKFPKFGFSNGEGNVEVNGVGDEMSTPNADAAMPMFKLHKLPKTNNDDTGGISDMFEQRKNEIEAKDYIMRKGVYLPVLNVKNKTGEKVDIMERLKIAKEKVPVFNVSPTEAKNRLHATTAIENSSLSTGGTFKVEKPEWNLERPNISTEDENDKFKYGLSNMLGLNTE